jgi:hypothetical protein
MAFEIPMAAENPITDQIPALQLAQKVLTLLTGTFKKLNLYSERHSIYLESLNLLKTTLNDVSDRWGHFKIDIRKNEICFEGQPVYQWQSEPADMGFILFRDGIQSIDFQPGMQLYEIDSFFKVLHKFCRLEEDAEDDIVTALWQYNLPSIKYEAADLDLTVDDHLDFTALKCRPEEQEAAEEGQPEDYRDAQAQAAVDAVGIIHADALSRQDDLWQITAQEHEQLRKMIAEEEKLDGTDYVIEVLLFIVAKQNHAAIEVTNLADILVQELREVLVQGRYAYLASIFVILKMDFGSAPATQGVLAAFAERLFGALSSSAFLSGLKTIENDIERSLPQDIQELKRALLLLPDACILTLGQMVLTIGSARTRRLILEVIGTVARRQFQLFEKLIQSSPPELIRCLVVVLGALKDEPSKKVLLSLVRHESKGVREEALKAVLAGDGSVLKTLFDLIEDPDENIRKFVLLKMGQKRDHQIETLILNYLNAHDFKFKDRDFFFTLLRTLGRCGSDRSVPVLENQLFLKPSLGILRPVGRDYREVLVNALKELNTQRAASLAARASRGFFSNILKSG